MAFNIPVGTAICYSRQNAMVPTAVARFAEASMTVKPYDPTLKTLVEIEPESWPVLLGYAKAPTEAIDADIATVSGAADKVLRVAGDPSYLLHLEFVSGHDSATLPGARFFNRNSYANSCRISASFNR